MLKTLIDISRSTFAVTMLASLCLSLCNTAVFLAAQSSSSLSWGELALAAGVQLGLFGFVGLVFGAILSIIFTASLQINTFQEVLRRDLPTKEQSPNPRGPDAFSLGALLRRIGFGAAPARWPETAVVTLLLGAVFAFAQGEWEFFVLLTTDRPREISVLVGSSLMSAGVLIGHRMWSALRARRAHASVIAAVLVIYLFYLIPTAFNPIGYADKMLLVVWVAMIWCVAQLERDWLEGLSESSKTRWVASSLCALWTVSALLGLSMYSSQPTLHTALSAHDAGLHTATLKITRDLWDLDGDGFAPWLMGGDCDDWSSEIHPDQVEIPGNGIDENCRGGDLPLAEANPHPVNFQTAPTRRSGAEPPNLLFISVDTLRADHFGLKVQGKALTPALDQLAAGSHVFDNSYAASTHTAESLPALMMGDYPSAWHHQNAFFGLNRSLAEILSAQGYQTLAFQSIPYMDPLLIHGFQKVDNTIGGKDKNWDLMTGMGVTTQTLNDTQGGAQLKKPFFLWVHYFDPHAFYLLNKELTPWLGSDDDLDSYKHEIHHTDQAINVLLGNLQHTGMLENTIIVFTSDHGEAFGEHGVHGHLTHAYDTILKVPLFIKIPGMGAGRHQARVSALDIFPTLINAMGIQDTHPRPGRDLAPLMRGETDTTGPIFAEVNLPDYHFQTVLFDQWKLIHNPKNQSVYLFDLKSDPLELRNLVVQEPDVYQRARAMLDRWHDQQLNVVRIKDRLRFAKERRLKIPPDSTGVFPDCFSLSPTFHRCR